MTPLYPPGLLPTPGTAPTGGDPEPNEMEPRPDRTAARSHARTHRRR